SKGKGAIGHAYEVCPPRQGDRRAGGCCCGAPGTSRSPGGVTHDRCSLQRGAPCPHATCSDGARISVTASGGRGSRKPPHLHPCSPQTKHLSLKPHVRDVRGARVRSL